MNLPSLKVRPWYNKQRLTEHKSNIKRYQQKMRDDDTMIAGERVADKEGKTLRGKLGSASFL